ncbi:MAG: hypothetical protein HEEMFOPI_00330 [Holosporales bacterium]
MEKVLFKKVKDFLFSNLLYVFFLFVSIFVYFCDIDGMYIPHNGDEAVYAHITKITAKTGSLLPLESEMQDMRNTKPPLLFWQGIFSTKWTGSWTLENLRYPNVIYTFLTAVLCFLLTFKISSSYEKAWQSFFIYLAFFSSYRFGRPFLTNAPENFWVMLSFFILLFPEKLMHRRGYYIFLTLSLGISLLYKSFAILFPFIFCLSFLLLYERKLNFSVFIKKDLISILFVVFGSLFIFSTWFIFDPDPQSIWNEFVLYENVGKIENTFQGYIKKLAFGSSSIWILLLGYIINAGIMGSPVIGLFVYSFKNARNITVFEKKLWIFLIVYILFFAIPHQRSSRYLISMMPMIAILLALNMKNIKDIWYKISHIINGILLSIMLYLSVCIDNHFGLFYSKYIYFFYGFVLFSNVVFVKKTFKEYTSFSILLIYGCLAGFLHPFNASIFNGETKNILKNKVIAVPSHFRSHEEYYQFLLPYSRIIAYDPDLKLPNPTLYQKYDYKVQRDEIKNISIDYKVSLKSRQSFNDVKKILKGDILNTLIEKQFILQKTHDCSVK